MASPLLRRASKHPDPNARKEKKQGGPLHYLKRRKEDEGEREGERFSSQSRKIEILRAKGKKQRRENGGGMGGRPTTSKVRNLASRKEGREGKPSANSSD